MGWGGGVCGAVGWFGRSAVKPFLSFSRRPWCGTQRRIDASGGQFAEKVWSLALACFLWVNTVLKPLSRGSPLGTMLRASDRWRGWHGAVGLVDTPSGAFVWCGCGWCCVAGGGPVVGQSCFLPSSHPKPPIRCHHTPRQTKCLGTPFPAQQQGILPSNQTHQSHPPSIPLRVGQS